MQYFLCLLTLCLFLGVSKSYPIGLKSSFLPTITARKRSLRRLCFHRCLSVHCILGYTPWCLTPIMHAGIGTPTPGQTPSWADTPSNPLGQTPPPGRHPHAQGRHPPMPRADTPWADIPTPWADTPPWADTSALRSACWDTVNKRAVRIPLECILVLGISSPCEMKNIILSDMRFNPTKARLMLNDSSLLNDIFTIDKKRTDSYQPQNVQNTLLSRSSRK